MAFTARISGGRDSAVSALLDPMKNAVLEAAANSAALRAANALEPEKKEEGTFVTRADKEAQEIIREKLGTLRSGMRFLGEEERKAGGAGKTRGHRSSGDSPPRA